MMKNVNLKKIIEARLETNDVQNEFIIKQMTKKVLMQIKKDSQALKISA